MLSEMGRDSSAGLTTASYVRDTGSNPGVDLTQVISVKEEEITNCKVILHQLA